MNLDWYHIRDAFILGVLFASGAVSVLGTVWLIVTSMAEGCT